MNGAELDALLASVRDGAVTAEDAARALRRLPFADLGMARIDHHRSLRQGMPEAVYAPGKSPMQCAQIIDELLSDGCPVVLSRATAVQVSACAPNGIITATGDDRATVVWTPASRRPEAVLVLSAGTADLPVANEAVATLTAYGIEAERIQDCGVAGLHRLLPHVDQIASAAAIIVVAGMEGALASVVGGIARSPVVAVPTSVGYGSSFQGVTALLAMLSSCAAGVTVVGIDNGYGAACAVMRFFGGVASEVAADVDSDVDGRMRIPAHRAEGSPT